jgi:hypothetical protein
MGRDGTGAGGRGWGSAGWVWGQVVVGAQVAWGDREGGCGLDGGLMERKKWNLASLSICLSLPLPLFGSVSACFSLAL